ncbi:MAG: AMP-binding protein [Kiloniellaceae bacterium]
MEPTDSLQSLIAGLAGRGDAPAVIAADGAGLEVWSFAELADRIARLAAGLSRCGVRRGEPVAVAAEPGPAALAACLALAARGAVIVVPGQRASAEALGRLVSETGCRRAFASVTRVSGLLSKEDLEIYLLAGGDPGPSGVRGWDSLLGEAAIDRPEVLPGDPAAMLQTAGATGRPKTVVLSHRNLAAAGHALARDCGFGPQDRVLLPPALYGCYPFLTGALAALAAGAAIVLPAGDGMPEMVRAMAAARVTAVIGTPRFYGELLCAVQGPPGAPPAGRAFTMARDLSLAMHRRFGVRLGGFLFRGVHARLGGRLRLLLSTGARLSPALAWQLVGLGWRMRQGYGLAEATSLVTLTPAGGSDFDTVGRPLPGVELRIDAPDDHGRGEVLVRAAGVFSGYLGDAAASAAARTGDGWLRTGDLGVLRGDGSLRLMGRCRDAFVAPGGRRIIPEIVEAAYGDSPVIAEFALLNRDGALAGLVVPDVRTLRYSGTGQFGYLLRVTLSRLGRRLPPEARITRYDVVHRALPRTALGGLRRGLLPELRDPPGRAAAAPRLERWPEAERRLLAPPRAKAVWDWLQARYPESALGPDSCLQLALGLDSLDWVGLSLDLERRLGIILSEDSLSRVVTLRDLLREAASASRAGEARGAGVYAGFRPAALSPDRTRWLDPPTGAHLVMRFAMYLANRLVCRACFGVAVEGAERLPPRGPLVLAFNHASDLDHFIVGAALDWRRLRRSYWAADDGRLFSGPVRRLFCRVWNAFPVNDRIAGSTVASGCAALSRGAVLCWFPEGWRSPDGDLLPFARGIGAVLKHTGARVVPGYISGSFEAFPRSRRLPRLAPIRVVFGRPLDPAALEAKGAGAEPYARIADALRSEMQALAEGTARNRAAGPV